MKAAAAILLALALACMMVAEPGHALTCPEVDACLAPCVRYLTGLDSAPPAACCEGVKKLRTLGTNTSERQFACNCVKEAASHFSNLKDDAVSSLPSKCGSPLPFPINTQFDCTKIPAY